MSNSFRFIFWGLLITMLDFSINGFDIFPDVIGHILVALGAARLAPLSSQFVTACALSWLLAVCDVFYFFSPNNSQLFDLFVTIVSAASMWTLLGGVMAFATDRQRPDLAERSERRRMLYIVLMIISSLLGLLGQAGIPAVGFLVLPVVIALLVVMVMILHLIHRVRYELVA